MHPSLPDACAWCTWVQWVLRTIKLKFTRATLRLQYNKVDSQGGLSLAPFCFECSHMCKKCWLIALSSLERLKQNKCIKPARCQTGDFKFAHFGEHFQEATFLHVEMSQMQTRAGKAETVKSSLQFVGVQVVTEQQQAGQITQRQQ